MDWRLAGRQLDQRYRRGARLEAPPEHLSALIPACRVTRKCCTIRSVQRIVADMADADAPVRIGRHSRIWPMRLDIGDLLRARSAIVARAHGDHRDAAPATFPTHGPDRTAPTHAPTHSRA